VKRDQELRRVESSAREGLAGLDGEFFASVAALLRDDAATAHADRLRRLRERQRARTTGRGYWSNAEGEASVDLVQLVYDKLREPDAFTPALTAALDGYAVSADRNMEDRAEAAADIARRLAMMERLRQRESGDEAARQQLMETMQENWRQAISAVRRADRAQAETNRAFLDQILAALPEDRRWTTEYDYRLAAYPDVYRESLGIESAFTRALEIPDLADSQRARVAESLTTYRDRFRRLSDRMIELRQSRDQMDFDFRPDRDMMERELELMRLRFDRKELGERASFDLTMLLDLHQRETLGQ
jgi:hypothetical protein